MSRDRKFWRERENVVHYRNRRPYNNARGNNDDYYYINDNIDDDDDDFFDDRREFDTFEYEKRNRPFRCNDGNNKRTRQTQRNWQNKIYTKRKRYVDEMPYDEDYNMEQDLNTRHHRHRRLHRAYLHDDAEQECERERYVEPLLEERHSQRDYDNDRDIINVHRNEDYNDFPNKEEKSDGNDDRDDKHYRNIRINVDRSTCLELQSYNSHHKKSEVEVEKSSVPFYGTNANKKTEFLSDDKESNVENNWHLQRNDTTTTITMNENHDNRANEMAHHHRLRDESYQPLSVSLSTSSVQKTTENKITNMESLPFKQGSKNNYYNSNRNAKQFNKSTHEINTLAQSSCINLYGIDSSVQNSHLLSLIEQLVGVRAVQIKRQTYIPSILHSSIQTLATMENSIDQSLLLQGNNNKTLNCSPETYTKTWKEVQHGQQEQQLSMESGRLDSMYSPFTLEFTELQHATRALELLNGAIINGKVIVATRA